MMFKTPILYGFMITLAASILMISLVSLDLLGPDAISSDKEMIGGTILFLMMYLFLLFGIYFVLKKAKEQNKGMFSFKTAIIYGLTTSFSTACFSVIFTYLFYEWMCPDYVSELLIAIEEKMILENIPAEKIEEKMTDKKNYYSTSIQAGYSFIGNLITGIAFTLLLSFFLKNKKINHN